jgi:hypothetical protein
MNNEGSAFLVVSAQNSPFIFTGSYANNIGFIVSNSDRVEITGSNKTMKTGESFKTSVYNPESVYQINVLGTGRVLVLLQKQIKN